MTFNQILNKLELQHLLAVIATVPIELILVPKITGQATTLNDALVSVIIVVLAIVVNLGTDSRRSTRKYNV